MSTYSFIDTHLSIIGAGGSVMIGAGSGVAEEGITVEDTEDRDTMNIGADGEVMHSLSANRSGSITVRLLKTSSYNALLQAMFNLQAASGGTWGSNVLTMNNPATGDTIVATDAAFRRQPTLVYAKVGNMNEWTFNCGKMMRTLGDNAALAA